MIRVVHMQLASLIVSIFTSQLLCAEYSGVEERIAQERAAASTVESKRFSVFENKLQETKTSLTNKKAVDYVLVMGNALRQAAESPIGSSKPGKKLIREYAEAVFNADIGEPPTAKSLNVQLSLYLETFAHDSLDVDELSDDDLESISLLLQLWAHSRKMEEFYSEFDPMKPTDEWKQKLDIIKIFASYNGPGASNLPPELIKDPKVREKYEAFLKNRTEYHRGNMKFGEIAKVGKRFRMRAARYLAEQFGDGPMDESLASLIRKHQPQHFEDVQKSIQDQIKLLKELDAWQPSKR